MKRLFLIALAFSFSVSAFEAQAEDACSKTKLKLPFLSKLNFKKKGTVPCRVPGHLAPIDQFDLIAHCPDPKPPKVIKLKTVELSRRAFQKMEEHCCGIMIRGNYMKVTYQTFYSDGSTVVWDKEYRS